MNADETYKNIIAKALRKTNEIFPLPNKLGIGRRGKWPRKADTRRPRRYPDVAFIVGTHPSTGKPDKIFYISYYRGKRSRTGAGGMRCDLRPVHGVEIEVRARRGSLAEQRGYRLQPI